MKKIPLTNEEIGSFCRMLAHLLHAGIGVGDALVLAAEDEECPHRRAMLEELARSADEGTPLSKALRYTGQFPVYVCALLEVGERAGRVEETLSALARYYEGRVQLDRRLRSALLYPAVLMLVLLCVVVILLVWVLPVFNDVYEQLGSGLTGVAGVLLDVGRWLKGALPVLCGILALLCLCAVVLALRPELRGLLLDGWRRRQRDAGVTGSIMRARFIQALAMAVSSGMGDWEAVELAGRLSEESDAFHTRCARCLEAVERGMPLAAALWETELLPRAECRLLEAGVRSGSGELALTHIAERMLEESEAALEARAARIEPALVVVMSLLVGAILLSVMLPLMNIMNAIE